MMTAWRLVKSEHQTTAFDEEGARRYGGRWNEIGTPMIYASESLALAALEYFVHLDISSTFNLNFVAIKISFTKNMIHEFDMKMLPKNWQENPPPLETQTLGSQWCREKSSVILKVPSMVIPTEYNYVLNPSHPNFDKIEISTPINFNYDERMFKVKKSKN